MNIGTVDLRMRNKIRQQVIAVLRNGQYNNTFMLQLVGNTIISLFYRLCRDEQKLIFFLGCLLQGQ